MRSVGATFKFRDAIGWRRIPLSVGNWWCGWFQQRAFVSEGFCGVDVKTDVAHETQLCWRYGGNFKAQSHQMFTNFYSRVNSPDPIYIAVWCGFRLRSISSSCCKFMLYCKSFGGVMSRGKWIRHIYIIYVYVYTYIFICIEIGLDLRVDKQYETWRRWIGINYAAVINSYTVGVRCWCRRNNTERSCSGSFIDVKNFALAAAKLNQDEKDKIRVSDSRDNNNSVKFSRKFRNHLPIKNWPKKY